MAAQGTITLPSGDKLITQTEVLPSGALVHREEVVISGTLTGQLALPTNTRPGDGDFGLPVRAIGVTDVALRNLGLAGTPLRVDPTGTTVQPISWAGAPSVSIPGTPAITIYGTPSVNVASLPPISFSGPQPISSIAGTVQVAFTPASTQNVNLQNVGFAGTPLRTDPTGATTQPVSIASPVNIGAVAGTVQVSFTSASSQDVNLRNVGFAGTPLRVDPTGTTTQPVSWAGAPSVSLPGTPAVTVYGTPSVNIASLPSVSFSSPQPISSISGTVQVAFTPASTQDVNLKNVGFAGTPLRIDPTGTTTQPISWAGAPTVSVPGTPAVTIFGTPSVNVASHPPISFASPQPISTIAGTVSVSFTPASTQDVNLRNVGFAGTPLIASFAGPQPISTIAGTVQVAFTPTSTQDVNLRNVGFAGTPLRIDPTGATVQPVSWAGAPPVSLPGTPAIVVFGTPSVNVASHPPISFASPQPISTISGTVQVAFTPTSTQDVNLRNVGFAGTPLRIDPTGTTTQPVSWAGAPTVSLPGTPAVVVFGTPSINIASHPPVSFSAPQPISTVAGTVQVALVSAVTQDVNVKNVGFAGTPLRIDPTGSTTQPISWAGAPSISLPGTPAVSVYGTPSVNVASHPPVSFASPQPISTIAGTVQVAFTPASVQDVNLKNVGFAGTPLRVDPTGTTTQPVSIAGTVNVAFTPASTQDVNLKNVGFSGTPLIASFASPQPISTIAGTVQVAFAPAASQNVVVTNSGFAGTAVATLQEQQGQTGLLTNIATYLETAHYNNLDTLEGFFAIGGHESLADEVRVVQITPGSSLKVNLRANDGREVGVPGTPIVASLSGTQSVYFSGQQPVHGTVVVSSLPPVSFSSPQPISTIAGTVNVAFVPAASQNVALTNVGFAGTPLRVDPTGTTTQPISWSGAPTVSVPGTPAVTVFGTPSVNVASHPPVSFLSPQPISTIAGTVQVAFTPSASQNVNLMNVGFAGTPLRIDPTGTTTQPVSVATLPSVTFAGQQPIIGTIQSIPPVTFASPQQVTFFGQQPVQGTVVFPSAQPVSVNNSPSITFLGQQPIVGTIQSLPPITFASAQQITFSGQQPVHGTVIVGSLPAITIAASQNVGISGTVSIPDYSRYSEQITQTAMLQLVDDIVHTANAALNKVAAIGGQVDDQSITLGNENNIVPMRVTRYRAQHVSLRNEGGFEVGTSGTPLRIDPTGTTTQPVSFPVAQPISTISGTVAVNTQTNVRDFKTARIDVGASGNTTIISSVAGRRLKVYAINMSTDRAGTIQGVWMDGNAPLSGTQTFLDREGLTHAVQPPGFLIASQPGTALIFHASANQFAFGMRGMLSYWDSDTF